MGRKHSGRTPDILRKSGAHRDRSKYHRPSEPEPLHDGGATPCPSCDGDAFVLGTLGRLVHYSCRYCGAQFSERDGLEVYPDDPV